MTLLLGVFLASVAGSIHCAAMCGSFVCLYAGIGARVNSHGFGAHAAYHGGRLVSYVTLGLAAGALGARVDHFGRMANIERGAAIMAGALMIAWASTLIATSLGVRPPRVAAPEWIRGRFGDLLLSLRDQPATVRAGAMGLLTTLLPCGWLYTFVVTAGGTGNAIGGAAVMLVFWAGTVPMLLGVGLGVQRIARPVARHLPVVSAVLVLTLGALSIAGKIRPLVAPHSAALHAHGSHALP